MFHWLDLGLKLRTSFWKFLSLDWVTFLATTFLNYGWLTNVVNLNQLWLQFLFICLQSGKDSDDEKSKMKEKKKDKDKKKDGYNSGDDEKKKKNKNKDHRDDYDDKKKKKDHYGSDDDKKKNKKDKHHKGHREYDD